MKKKWNWLKNILCLLGLVLCAFLLDYLSMNVGYLMTRKNYQEENLKVVGNKDHYVPQGLTYDEKSQIVLQTSYHKKHDISRIYISDFTDGEFVKSLDLYDSNLKPITGHVGGITTNGEKVWITSDSTIWEFLLEDILMGKDRVSSIIENELPIRGDFCTYYDGELYIGDFFQKIFWSVENDTPLLLVYPVEDSIDYQKPTKIASIPGTVQGMVITPEHDFYFTHSYTFLNPSKLSVYSNVFDKYTDDTYRLGKEEIPYYHFQEDDLENTITLPSMAEEFFYKDGRLYLLFESSCDSYRLAFPKIHHILSYKIK